ncbi:unnamed protein product, partial [Heterosigma akashiwo]
MPCHGRDINRRVQRQVGLSLTIGPSLPTHTQLKALSLSKCVAMGEINGTRHEWSLWGMSATWPGTVDDDAFWEGARPSARRPPKLEGEAGGGLPPGRRRDQRDGWRGLARRDDPLRAGPGRAALHPDRRGHQRGQQRRARLRRGRRRGRAGLPEPGLRGRGERGLRHPRLGRAALPGVRAAHGGLPGGVRAWGPLPEPGERGAPPAPASAPRRLRRAHLGRRPGRPRRRRPGEGRRALRDRRPPRGQRRHHRRLLRRARRAPGVLRRTVRGGHRPADGLPRGRVPGGGGGDGGAGAQGARALQGREPAVPGLRGARLRGGLAGVPGDAGLLRQGAAVRGAPAELRGTVRRQGGAHGRARGAHAGAGARGQRGLRGGLQPAPARVQRAAGDQRGPAAPAAAE